MSERLDTLAREMVQLRETKDRTAQAAKKAKEEYDRTQAEFWEHLDDQGLTTFNIVLPGIGKVQFQKRETIRGIVKDAAAAATSLEHAGLGEALLGERSIRQGALSEHVRDWLAAGQEIPEGIDFNPTRYVSISRKDK